MFCKYCGAENADGAKFCKSCGKLLTSEENKSTSSEPKKESSFDANKLLEKARLLPKKTLIGIIIGIIAVIAIAIVTSLPPTINLNDYIVYETSGYDGYGECKISVDWPAVIEKYGAKVKYTSKAKKDYGSLLEYAEAVEVIKNDSKLHQDVDDNLHNGDVVNYTWNVDDEELKNYIKCNVKYANGSYIVTGLEEATKIDFFKGASEPYVIFTGRSGNTQAELNINFENGTELYRDENIIVVYSNDGWSSMIKVIQDNQQLCSIQYSIDNKYNLSNGDVVTLSLSGAKKLIDYGYLPEKDNIKYTVENRPELLISVEDIDVDLVLDFMDKELPKSSDNITYSNMEVHGIYFAKAKDTTVTDYPVYLLIDYSFDCDYNSRFMSDRTYNRYKELRNIYYDNDELVAEKNNYYDYGSYSWDYENIEDYIEQNSEKYDFEQIY